MVRLIVIRPESDRFVPHLTGYMTEFIAIPSKFNETLPEKLRNQR